MKKLLILALTLILALCLVGSASAEKVFHTYLTSDTETLNGQNSVQSNVNTPATYCQATLYRAVADESGLNFHYEPEIAAALPEPVEGKENTWKIAQRCNVEITFGETKLPRFDVPDGKTSWEYLNELCRSGLKEPPGSRKLYLHIP